MASFPPAAHDVFRFDELLTREEKDIRYRTRAFMVSPHPVPQSVELPPSMCQALSASPLASCVFSTMSGTPCWDIHARNGEDDCAASAWAYHSAQGHHAYRYICTGQGSKACGTKQLGTHSSQSRAGALHGKVEPVASIIPYLGDVDLSVS